ncbi:hypothetical protein QWZ08_10580 [Ferruginibacter paludis]|uniref:hypothetical protein n=1 Tax=Ferruginibacter paludis TaxID=1310417 RepID=UPI0025B55E0B|nr:hypothetical protein [Ferruginibacter paludis]MDN3656073.1 hypothetical protein [Ferruginibacter paludis]
MKMFLCLLATVFLFMYLSFICNAQDVFSDNLSKDTSRTPQFTMPAGSRFAATKWKQFWWGKHWRKEWLTPVSFPLFNWDTTAGCLTPIKKGGGHQTQTLRLLGNDGREYVLRTMDKTLDVLIPEEFKGSFINDIANDQISTAHPYGALAIAQLAGGIGILHTNPVIEYVPGNERLGMFTKDFADKLCLFEERPSGEGWSKTSFTDFADNIINSEKLFKKLQSDNSSQVDQKEFLKIRLFDMLINDWDRHEDQWVWVAHKKNEKTIYQPFARDRDQGFSKTDGVNLFLLSRPWALRSIQNMDANVKDVIGTNLAATFLDKQFLNVLTEADWKNTIVALQQLLTDSLIKKALLKMPPAIYSLSGDFLYKRLRQRRDNMLKFGLKYYKILNKAVTITGTDKQEVFIINKIDKDNTEITVLAKNKKNTNGEIIFSRIFNHAVTKEITLYGLGGCDEFIYKGRNNNKIFDRVVGGDGNDLYEDSVVNKTHGKKSPVYDSPSDMPASSKSFSYKPTNDTSITNYNRMEFKYDWWLPLIIPGYNPDDGFVVGAGLIYKKRQWKKKPFGWQQTFIANYAAATGAFNLFYNGIFKKKLGKWDFDLTANYNAPSFVLNFYGFGNNTKLLYDDKNFYRVSTRGFFFNPGISRLWNNTTFKAGLIFNTVKVERRENKFINLAIPLIDSSVFKNKYFAGAKISYSFNNSDVLRYPSKGINFNAKANYLVNLKEGKRNFVNAQSNLSFYYTPFKNITLAHRTGASENFGEYEFYQANTIGGHDELRGYWRTRFTGRGSFYQNTDVRIKLAALKGYVLRGMVGVYGFFDDGRVWAKYEKSTLLHIGYGGGIYFIPYNALAVNLSYAASREVNVFTFRIGFLF